MPVPTALPPQDLLTLKPLLDRRNPALYRADGKTPLKPMSTGHVLRTFFDRSREWLHAEIRDGRVREDGDIPPVGENGSRQWTLADVEAFAFALFRSGKNNYDAATLSLSLAAVHAVAQVQGILPPP